MKNKHSPHEKPAKGPAPDPWAKMDKSKRTKIERLENERQSIVDRCWNSLPEGSPLRLLGRDSFDDIYGDWDPVITATIDPKLEMDFSILIADMIDPSIQYAGEQNLMAVGGASYTEQFPYFPLCIQPILLHQLWLLNEGSKEDLEAWNAEVLGCKNNMIYGRNEKLIILLQVALGVPHEEGRYATFDMKPGQGEESKQAFAMEQAKIRKMRDYLADRAVDTKAARKVHQSFVKKPPGELNGCASINITQYKIREECIKLNRGLFSDLSKDSWKELFEQATKHWGRDFPKRRQGTTPKKRGVD